MASQYNFDPTGSDPLNLIEGETHPLDTSTFRVLTPLGGLMYTKTAILVRSDNGDALVKNVDFKYLDLNQRITIKTGRETAGAIHIINNAITGNIILTYQVVGGSQDKYRFDTLDMLTSVEEFLATKIPWDQVVGKPLGFTPDPHIHTVIEDLAGLNEVRDTIYDLDRSMLDRDLPVDNDLTITNRLVKILKIIKEQRVDITEFEANKVILGFGNILNTDAAIQIDNIVTLNTDGSTKISEAEILNIKALELTREIVAPVINSPVEGDINVTGSIDLDPFLSYSNYTGTHFSTDWEIANDSLFTNILESSYDNVINLLSYFPKDLLTSTQHYVRVRFKSDNHVSEWSDIIGFITSAVTISIQTPTITSPIEASTDIALKPVLQADSFLFLIGGGTHTATDWEIATDINFDTIIYQAFDSLDLVSHTVSSNLPANTLLYIRCRYKSDGNLSSYSTPVSFTTLFIAESVMLIGEAGNETFNDVVFDSSTSNYIAVGKSSSAGAGGNDCFIAVFDASLNLINDKLIGDTGNEIFHNIIIDPITNNYVCVGSTDSDGAGGLSGYIAIFDSSLTLVNDKIIGGITDEELNGITFDTVTNNYICVGYSDSAGTGLTDAYIAIFNSSLVLQNDKLIGGITDEELNGITFDTVTNNYICVGYSDSAGTGLTDAYIAIFNSSLVLQNDKLIGGITDEELNGITFDTVTNNYICVGYSDSAGTGLTDAYIAIFNSSLVLQSNKLIGGTSNDYFMDVNIDTVTNNYICVGYSDSAGTGLTDAYIAIFNSSLVLQSNKLIGGAGDEAFLNIAINSSTNDYICVGSSDSTGAGLNDAMVMTFIKNLTLADGAIPDIPSLIISTPILTETSPAFTETSPILTETSPAFTETSPTFTEIAPVLIETFSNY